MKKISVSAILLIMVLCAGFLSCSRNDDDKVSKISIVGDWEMVGKILTVKENGTVINQSTEEVSSGSEQLTFRSDGKAAVRRNDAVEWEGSYTLENTTLTLKADKKKEKYEVKKLTPDELYLAYIVIDNSKEYIYEYSFQRVK